MSNTRWIIVSSRLPVALSSDKKSLVRSAGGLVTAIESIKSETPRVWVGCAPSGVEKPQWELLKDSAPGKTDLHPIFVDEKLYDDYYNGFSNDSLWPLLHYESERTRYTREHWDAYKKVNQIFADELQKIVRPGDLVWIHDFHFFLLPKMLRARVKDCRIGFFLHIPFPSSEVFRQMPHREELLESVLASDLIGFHDYSYLRHFASSLLRVLGIESSFLSVNQGTHKTQLGVFPVSIDTDQVHRDSRESSALNWAKKLRSEKFVFLGVDRLDYTKGVDHKLRGYRRFLEKYPEYHEKVRLIQIAVPTRTGVQEYQDLKSEVEGLVGEINGRFGTSTWTPVRYIYSSVSKPELMALYRTSDSLLVTSKRDGMNLVALEYIAAQDKANPGVVLLSEFTGAMSMLGQTVPVNPWNPELIADRMLQAIKMEKQERQSRWSEMFNYLKNYTATDWATAFMKNLQRPKEQPKKSTEIITPTTEKVKSILGEIDISARPNMILFVDYDGTLTPITSRPNEAILSEEAKEQLLQLKNLGAEVVIVSGRPSQFLEQQIGLDHFFIAAEHGGRVYDPSKKQWKNLGPTRGREWYKLAGQIMDDYARRVQNSFVEKKTFGLSWHYRLSPPEYASYLARKLQEELEMGLVNQPVTIISGKKVLEVKANEANKGSFCEYFLQKYYLDQKPQIIAIGDDRTDEDLFAAINPFGITIKVGEEDTLAKFSIPHQSDVRELFESLIVCLSKRQKKTNQPLSQKSDEEILRL